MPKKDEQNNGYVVGFETPENVETNDNDFDMRFESKSFQERLAEYGPRGMPRNLNGE